MIAADLLAEARAAGVVLTLGIRLQGPCSSDLRDRLRAQEAGLLDCLVAEAASGRCRAGRAGLFSDDTCKGTSGSSGSSGSPQNQPPGPLEGGVGPDEGSAGTSEGSSDKAKTGSLLPGDADPARPPSGWTFVGSGRLAGCWVGPNGELAASSSPRGQEEPR